MAGDGGRAAGTTQLGPRAGADSIARVQWCAVRCGAARCREGMGRPSRRSVPAGAGVLDEGAVHGGHGDSWAAALRCAGPQARRVKGRRAAASSQRSSPSLAAPAGGRG